MRLKKVRPLSDQICVLIRKDTTKHTEGLSSPFILPVDIHLSTSLPTYSRMRQTGSLPSKGFQLSMTFLFGCPFPLLGLKHCPNLSLAGRSPDMPTLASSLISQILFPSCGLQKVWTARTLKPTTIGHKVLIPCEVIPTHQLTSLITRLFLSRYEHVFQSSPGWLWVLNIGRHLIPLKATRTATSIPSVSYIPRMPSALVETF